MKNEIELITKQMKEVLEFGILMNKDEEFIKDIMKEIYFVDRRNENYIKRNSFILEFIYNYNINNFNIGGVSFFDPSEIFEKENLVNIGTDGSGDFLTVDKTNDSIYNYIDNVEYKKISNSSFDFFTSLLKIAKFNLFKQEDRTRDKMNEILSEISANEYSKQFYSTLILDF